MRTHIISLLAVLILEAVAIYIDDSIHHDILYHSISDAPNPEELLKLYNSPSDDYMTVHSYDHERYVCKLPETVEEKLSPTSIYNGPSPAELLSTLINEKLCTYRQDTYWWYELCHGRYILQFHEDKASKKRTEFYLGNYKQDYISMGTTKIEQMNPPTRFFDNEERAYYNVSYTHGTYCDLIKGPRTTNILYICSEEHKHYFHSYMELSSCKYEIIILTNRLCSHPAYKAKQRKNRQIHCYNVDENSPGKPAALEEMEKTHENTFKNEYIIKVLTDSESEILKDIMKEMLQEYSSDQPMRILGEKRKGWDLPSPFPSSNVYHETVDLILTGKECINADHGWWNFEICYGKTIKQIHYEGSQRLAEHLIGSFDPKIQRIWVEEAPEARKPKVFDDRVMQLSHIYSKGDICHEVKAHRSAEVRIRCKQAQSILGTVTLTIEEPSVCQYFIIIESDRFCEPIQYADDHGIISLEPISPPNHEEMDDDEEINELAPSVTTDVPPTDFDEKQDEPTNSKN